MIEKGYVVQLARYNAWQNRQLRDIFKVMSEEDLRAERGAFFGSIFATMTHILWADRMWMSRWCSDIDPPGHAAAQAASTPNFGVWDAERFRLDGRIRIWAETLSNIALRDTVEWYSDTLQQTMRQPMGLCVVHMFNHQTHHRGQIHQMLSAAGKTPPVSDIIFMPQEA